MYELKIVHNNCESPKEFSEWYNNREGQSRDIVGSLAGVRNILSNQSTEREPPFSSWRTAATARKGL